MMKKTKYNNYLNTSFKEYLNESVNNSISDRYILLYYDEYGEEFEEYDIDMYESADQAEEVAKNGGVTILSDKRLVGILFDIKLPRVIGGLWVSDDRHRFSFDIAIDSSYQNMGLSKILIEGALGEYEMQKDVYDEIGNDFQMEVDVINPKLAKILKSKYGFHVIGELSQNRVLMSL